MFNPLTQVSQYFYPEAVAAPSDPRAATHSPLVSVGTGAQTQSLNEGRNYVFSALYGFLQYFCPKAEPDACTDTDTFNYAGTQPAATPPSTASKIAFQGQEKEAVQTGGASLAGTAHPEIPAELTEVPEAINAFRGCDLASASCTGNLESVKQLIALLSTQAAIDAARPDVMIALNFAATNGHADCFKELLGLLPADEIDRHGSSVQTLLAKAAEYGHADCFKQLLELMKPEAACRFVAGELVGAAGAGRADLLEGFAGLLNAPEVTGLTGSYALKSALVFALQEATNRDQAACVTVLNTVLKRLS